MWLLSRFARLYLLSRLFGPRGRGGRGRNPYGYGYGYGRRRRRGRAGFLGPFPSYTTRTRGGSRVTVSGCCLPIPLALSAGLVAGLRVLLRR